MERLSLINSKQVRNIVNSSDAFRILDKHVRPNCTWTSGGCLVLAEAFKMFFGTKCRIFAFVERGTPQHIVAEYNGLLFDADGFDTPDKKLEFWNSAEQQECVLDPFNIRKNKDIPRNRKCSREMADFLRKNFTKDSIPV